MVVTYLARLQTIPPELYEAATVDGASAWRRFLHVTLPQTASVLFVIVLLRSIWMFTKFDTVWLLAGDGGVSRYIRTLPVYAYARSFTYLQAGMGAALAVIMFAMLLVGDGGLLPHVPDRGGVLVRRARRPSTRPARSCSSGPPSRSSGCSRPRSSPRGRSSPPRASCRCTPTLENFQRLFADTSFLVFFRNSVAGGAAPPCC